MTHWRFTLGVALRLGLGEMAQILLTGQHVVPAAAKKLRFEFRYPKLRDALEACITL